VLILRCAFRVKLKIGDRGPAQAWAGASSSAPKGASYLGVFAPFKADCYRQQRSSRAAEIGSELPTNWVGVHNLNLQPSG
jgi:hypothetical protein